MKKVLTDIVVPVFGALSYLRRCVGAVLGNTLVDYVLWIVDDCSLADSGIREYLSAMRDPRISVVFNEENLGFGPTCNHGVAQGSAPFVCILNSDTEVQEGWLTTMLANMGDPKVGMVGAKLIFPPLSTQTNYVHLPGRIQHAGLYFGADKLPREAFLNYLPGHPLVNRRIEVSAVTHACVLIRRSAWGEGYDPRYTTGAFEDVDMCLAIAEQGYKIIYEPDALVWHAQGASYDHLDSNANLDRLMEKWQSKIVPDPDIFSKDRKVLSKPEIWW